MDRNAPNKKGDHFFCCLCDQHATPNQVAALIPVRSDELTLVSIVLTGPIKENEVEWKERRFQSLCIFTICPFPPF